MSQPEISNPLLAVSGNLRRRHAVNRAMEISAWIAALLAVAVLVLLIASVTIKGISSISIHFFTQNTANFGGGGIGNAIVGTGIIVGIATLMAVPFGVLVAIYTSEFAGPRSNFAIRYVLDIMNGVPTIVTAIFIFGLIVVPQGKQSGFAGSVAGAGARGEPLADDALGGHPDGAQRHDHRRAARGSASVGGDGAAAADHLDLPGSRTDEPFAGDAEHPGDDLQVLGVPRPGQTRAGLGGGADPDRDRARDQHRRAAAVGSVAETPGCRQVDDRSMQGSAL